MGGIVGSLIKVAGIAATAYTGNPLFSQLGSAGSALAGSGGAGNSAKKAEAAAAATLEADRKKAADEAEKKRKARLPVDTVLSNPSMAGTLR